MKSAIQLFASLLVAASCLLILPEVNNPLAATATSNQAAANQAPNQNADEVGLRRVIENFLAACQKKDLVALMGLWNHRSTEMVATLEKLNESFEKEDYSFSGLAIDGLKTSGNRAILRATANLSITKTDTRETRTERFARNFALIRESGEWRIFLFAPESQSLEFFLQKGAEWRTSNTQPVAEQFAAALLNVDEKSREALLADNREVVTVDLRKELLKQAEARARISSSPLVFTIFRLAQKVAESIGDKEGVALSQLGMARAFGVIGNRQEALPLFQKALSIFEELKDKKQMGLTLEEVGDLYFRWRDHSNALKHYKEALAIYESLNIQTGIANAREEIASVYYSQQKFADAITEYEKAIKIREALGKKPELAATQNNIGNAYYGLEQYDTAIDFYQKAITGFEANNDQVAIAGACNNIGSCYYSLGNYDAALDAYQKGLKIELEVRYRQGETVSLYGIGLVHYARGDYGQALEYYNKRLALLEFLREAGGLPDTLHSIGLVYMRLQNLPLALAAYQKALPIYQALKDPESQASALQVTMEIGGIYFAQRNYDAAMEQYRAALDAYQKGKQNLGMAKALSAIGAVYAAQKLYDQALESYQKSLSEYEQFNEKERVGDTLNNIASVHFSRGDYPQALKFAEQATELARQINNIEILWASRHIAGSSQRMLNQLEEARAAFEQSIAAIETLRAELIDDEQAAAFFQDKRGPYLAMMEWLLVQNRAVEAFSYAEAIRSQRLWDMFRNVRLRINKTMTAAEQEQQSRLSKAMISVKRQHEREKTRKNRDEQRLATLTTRLQKARQEYEAFKTRLYTAHPQLKTLRGEAPAFKAEEAHRLLDTKTALLEFSVAESQSVLFVVTKDNSVPDTTTGNRPAQAINRTTINLKAYFLNIGRADLEARIAKFREAITRPDPSVNPEISQAARDLYDLLLKAAGAQLAGKESLVIVPDPGLWGLPFQALQPSENHYLIEDFAVTYAPSLLSLRDPAKPRASGVQSAPTLLAFANPMVSKETMDRLKLSGSERLFTATPEAEAELKALRQIYGEQQSRAYTAADASEERFKGEAETSQVLHLATTVLLSDASPLYSSIILSQTREDGLLQAWEAMNLNLKAEATVLTTCETSEAAVADGSGVTGFAWSWFIAGSPTLILNQWKSEVRETDLLLELHRNLKLRQPPAQALRQAALKLIKSDKSHPVYWSRFAVVKTGS